MHFKLFNLAAALAIAASTAAPVVAASTPAAHSSAGRSPLTGAPTARVVGETTPDSSAPAAYIVQLADAPLASYRGGVAGLAATSPTLTRTDLDRARPAVRAYANYLARRQDSSLDAISQRIGRRPAVRFRYLNAFHGFALALSPREAALVAALDGVRLIQRVWTAFPQTDRGPAWIGAPSLWQYSPTAGRGEGVVVGIIDTGINFASPSFTATASDGYTHTNPRGRFYGVCDATSLAYDSAFPCNAKLIGAWDFADAISNGAESDGPADSETHGSHTASTVAGNPVTAVITAPTTVIQRRISGVAPRASIIAYDVCYAGGGCPGDALVAAIDQAAADGVNVVNFSIGGPSRDPWTSADAIAMLGAADAGVFVSVSAGNEGPDAGTLGAPSNAPWVTSVAASTHDRKFTSAVTAITDGSSSFADLPGAAIAAGVGPRRIIDAANFTSTLAAGDGICSAPFPAGTFNGEIVVCERGINGRVEKGSNVLAGGAGGMILVNNEASGDSLSADMHELPAIHISYADGLSLRALISALAFLTATITPFTITLDAAAGDHLAAFSSRGPDATTSGVIKPDIAAPGVDIIAAAHNGADYASLSGTSMAAPHIAGAAALLTALHPDWTPSEIRSALMLTSLEAMLKEDGATPSDPFDRGAGRAQVNAALDTLLVLDENAANFAAADPAAGGDPSTLNIASLMQTDCLGTCSWTRTFRNPSLTTTDDWTISSTAPASLTLSASPAVFTLGPGETQVVTFTADVSTAALNAWIFGSFKLIGDVPTHLPVAVRAGIMTAPYDADGLIEVPIRRAAGSLALEGLRSVASSSLTARAYTGSEQQAVHSITQDPTPDDLNDDLSVLFTTTVMVTEATRLVRIRTSDTTAPDLDLYVGVDANANQQLDVSELVCISASISANESCAVANPAANLLVVVQSYRGSPSGYDDFTLSVLSILAGVDDPAVAVQVPPSAAAGERFAAAISWNLPNLAIGDTHFVAIEVSASPTQTQNAVLRILGITRVGSHMDFFATGGALVDAGYLLPGQQVTFTATMLADSDVPPGTTYVITATLPDSVDYVPATAQLHRRGAKLSADPVVNGRTLVWTLDAMRSAPHYVISTNDPARADFSAACSAIGEYQSIARYDIAPLPGVAGDDKRWNVDTLSTYSGGPLYGSTFYEFFGRARPQYYLTDDGVLMFRYAEHALHDAAPQSIPSAAAPNAIVAPFWSDMEIAYDPVAGRGVRILSGLAGSIVEYDGLQVKNDPSVQIDMQVTTYRSASGGPEIIFQYGAISGTLPTGVVGIENDDGSDGAVFTGAITSGLNICIDWTVDTVDLTYGGRVRNDAALDTTISATLQSMINAPGRHAESSSLQMFVSGVALETSVVAPDRVLPGKPVTYTVLVTNTGVITAANVTVEATVPLGSQHLSGGTHAGGIVSFSIASLAAQSSTALQFSVMPTFTAERPSPGRPTIISGTIAAPGAWPWQAALVLNSALSASAGQFCGGSLISRDFVLTAAHCTNNYTAAQIRVVLGRNLLSGPGGQEIQVSEIIQHPDYDPITTDNDIALLRLETPATLNAKVQPIAIATSGHAAQFRTDVLATVTGWGNINAGPIPDYPDELYQAQVPIVDQATCVANYAVNNQLVTDNMICAGWPQGGTDSCQGDSGGPLAVPNGAGWLLAGVVSWGRGCAEPNYPGVYARVSRFANYVRDMQRSLGPVYVDVGDGSGLAGHGSNAVTASRTVAQSLQDVYVPAALR